MAAISERRNEIKWTGAFAQLILQKHIRYILEYFSPLLFVYIKQKGVVFRSGKRIYDEKSLSLLF